MGYRDSKCAHQAREDPDCIVLVFLGARPVEKPQDVGEWWKILPGRMERSTRLPAR